MFKKAFGVLQKVGQALMLPVALLPAAGLLLGFGNAAQQETMLNYLPFLSADWIQMTARVMEDAGGIIFGNLALIFAIGVAIGLSKRWCCSTCCTCWLFSIEPSDEFMVGHYGGNGR